MFQELLELCIKQNSLKRRQEVPLMSAGVFHHIMDYSFLDSFRGGFLKPMFNLGPITDLTLTFIFYFNSIMCHPECGSFWQKPGG